MSCVAFGLFCGCFNWFFLISLFFLGPRTRSQGAPIAYKPAEAGPSEPRKTPAKKSGGDDDDYEEEEEEEEEEEVPSTDKSRKGKSKAVYTPTRSKKKKRNDDGGDDGGFPPLPKGGATA